MCGIVGIIGTQDVADRLLDGLKRLEYRGYDSAGIATDHDGRIERRRATFAAARFSRALDAFVKQTQRFLHVLPVSHARRLLRARTIRVFVHRTLRIARRERPVSRNISSSRVFESFRCRRRRFP